MPHEKDRQTHQAQGRQEMLTDDEIAAIPPHLWPAIIAVNHLVQVANAAKAARASKGLPVAYSSPVSDILKPREA